MVNGNKTSPVSRRWRIVGKVTFRSLQFCAARMLRNGYQKVVYCRTMPNSLSVATNDRQRVEEARSCRHSPARELHITGNV